MDFEKLYRAERREKENERREKENERCEKENEKRGRLEAEEDAEKERHSRLKAEKVAKKAKDEAQKTTIPEVLTLYHAKSLRMKVANNGLAGGEVSKPVGRKYPKLITPWEDFASEQQRIWDIIRASSTYSDRLFDSSNIIEAIKLQEIRSETELVLVDDLIILKPMKAILNCLFEDKELREQLKLQEDADFRSSWDIINGSQAANYPKDVGAQADAFFVSGPRGVPRHVYSIDYPPLFKFSATDIVRGLQGEIFPDQEVIKKDTEGPDHDSRRLVTVVITPLYSYLLKAGICYGYINIGDMIIFLHIFDDPGHVECHVWNPRDFDFNHSAFTHNTAIAEIVAFSVQALSSDRQIQTWNDAATRLEIWPQEDDGVPDDTPRTDREESTEPDTCGYKRQADSFGCSSPVRTSQQAQYQASKGVKKKDDEPDSSSLRKGISGCRPKDLGVTKKSEDSEDVESGKHPLRPSHHTGRSIMGGAGKKGKGDGDKTAGNRTEDYRKRVREREYCSLSCLLGLSQGGHLDLDCPNIADHGKRHLAQIEFLSLVREQLARHRGRVTDCEPLWINGSRGEMFKITLTSHGYTVIAKGVQIHNVPHIKNEAKIYRHLRSLQGIHIPVCLGAINLILPYYHKGGVFVRFLFQSYAGMPVRHTINEKNKDDILSKLTHAMTAIHQLRVLHGDPDPVNFLIDEKSGVLQVIDFERSQICDEKEKEVASSSSSKKKLPRGARLAKANETVVIPPPSSPSKNSMVEQPAGQNREGVKMTGEEFIFKEERFTAYYQTLMKMR